MQKHSVPGLHVLVHPNQIWRFPVNKIAIKVPKCTKTRDKSVQFRLRICGLFPVFKFSL